MANENNVRRIRRWWIYGVVAALLVGGGLTAALMVGRAKAKQRAAHLDQLLAIVDQEYQRCALGSVPAPSELGHAELRGRLLGFLTPGRARSCAAIVRDKLEPLSYLEHEDKDLGSFFLPVYVSDQITGVGVCEHVAAVRMRANELGRHTVLPDCSSKLPELEPTVAMDPAEHFSSYLRDHVLVFDVKHRPTPTVHYRGESHTLRGTYDGKSWEEAPPIVAMGDLHVASNAGNTGGPAFGYAFANDNENARYAVYDGEEWHMGALAVGGGGIVKFRCTSNGWTIVTNDETPLVVRLDPLMDKVLEKTPIKALAKRWDFEVERDAIIDKDGNATALRVAQVGDHVEIESHIVLVGRKPEPVIITKLDGHLADVSMSRCGSGTMVYVVVQGVATLYSSDHGRSFTQIPGGQLADDGQLACTEHNLYVASERQYTSCDRTRCITQTMPVPPHKEVALDLEMVATEPSVFVTIEDQAIAFLLEPQGDKGELQPASIWHWHNPILMGVPFVQINGVWFRPSKPSI